MYGTASYWIRTSWFNGLFRSLLDLILEWQDRSQQRRRLAEMGPRMLKDIGLSRADVWQEVHKPFWRA